MGIDFGRKGDALGEGVNFFKLLGNHWKKKRGTRGSLLGENFFISP